MLEKRLKDLELDKTKQNLLSVVQLRAGASH